MEVHLNVKIHVFRTTIKVISWKVRDLAFCTKCTKYKDQQRGTESSEWKTGG